jgi:hypothetical protein
MNQANAAQVVSCHYPEQCPRTVDYWKTSDPHHDHSLGRYLRRFLLIDGRGISMHAGSDRGGDAGAV